MTQYAQVKNGILVQVFGLPDVDGMGPPAPPPFADDEEVTYHFLAAPVDWSGRQSATSEMMWNDGSPAWAEAATLAEIKARKTGEINAAKEAANRAYFMFQGERIQADASSMLEIMTTNGWVALTGEFHPGFPKAWKTADDGYVLLPDVAAWREFYGAIAATGQANFDYAQELKAALAAATTSEQIAAITWGDGPTQPPEEV